MGETKIMGLPGGGRWVLETKDGMGGFLSPPGDPAHTYAFLEYRGSRSMDYETSMSVESAATEKWVPARVRAKAKQILASAKRECTDEWVESIYRYFRNCYSPDGVDRNVSNCLIVKPNPNGFGYVHGESGWLESLPPAEHHLAVLYIRKYFPDHEPRMDLIENTENR